MVKLKYFSPTEELWDRDNQKFRFILVDKNGNKYERTDSYGVRLVHLDSEYVTDLSGNKLESREWRGYDDPIVNEVVDLFRERSIKGIEKYGTTLFENNSDNFLQHLQEELMDAVLYVQKLKALMNREVKMSNINIDPTIFDVTSNKSSSNCIYQVWLGKYIVQGQAPLRPKYLGKFEASSFVEACKKALKQLNYDLENFNEETMTYHDIKLYANESDANK